MAKLEANMQELFGLDTPVVVEAVATSTTVVLSQPSEVLPAPNENDSLKELNRDLEEDYNEGRDNLRELIRKGTDAIDSLLAIAEESEHPRAYEVVATLIKNTAEVNEKLMAMQKTVRELRGVKTPGGGNTNIDKAIFVGSTADLNKLIKGKTLLDDSQ